MDCGASESSSMGNLYCCLRCLGTCSIISISPYLILPQPIKMAPGRRETMKRTTVRATCPSETCGDIRTDIENVVLRLPEGGIIVEGQYRFICPNCHTIVLKTASPSTISLLTTAGAKTEYYTPSLEILERPTESSAEPISLDDLIDLHLEIERDEEAWISQMKNRTEEP